MRPKVRSVAHQTSGRSEIAILIDRWHRVAERERGKLFALAGEKWIGGDYEPAGPQLDHGCENSIEVVLGPGMQDMKLQPQGREPPAAPSCWFRQDWGWPD